MYVQIDGHKVHSRYCSLIGKPFAVSPVLICLLSKPGQAFKCELCVCTGSALTAVVAARVPPAAAISPLAGPPDLEDVVDAQIEKVRLVHFRNTCHADTNC